MNKHRILNKSGLGIVVNPDNEKAIAQKLFELINCKDSLRSKFSLNVEYINEFHFEGITEKLVRDIDI